MLVIYKWVTFKSIFGWKAFLQNALNLMVINSHFAVVVII